MLIFRQIPVITEQCFQYIPYQPLLRWPLINADPFYAGRNSATPKIWLNAT